MRRLMAWLAVGLGRKRPVAVAAPSATAVDIHDLLRAFGSDE